MRDSSETGTPYKPRGMDIAGIEIYGTRQDDGSIAVGSGTDAAVVMPAFPPEIEVAGTIYTLEFVKENDGPWRKKASPDDLRLRICWGIYV